MGSDTRWKVEGEGGVARENLTPIAKDLKKTMFSKILGGGLVIYARAAGPSSGSSGVFYKTGPS